MFNFVWFLIVQIVVTGKGLEIKYKIFNMIKNVVHIILPFKQIRWWSELLKNHREQKMESFCLYLWKPQILKINSIEKKWKIYIWSLVIIFTNIKWFPENIKEIHIESIYFNFEIYLATYIYIVIKTLQLLRNKQTNIIFYFLYSFITMIIIRA